MAGAFASWERRSPRVLQNGALGIAGVAFSFLMACGASTELDDFSEGFRADGGIVFDVGPDARFPQPGEVIAEFTGRTDMDGTFWARPFDCSGTVTSPGYAYSVVTFRNSNARELRVTIDVDWADGFDGYLHAYSRFDTGQLQTDCLGFDDDFETTERSRIINIRVPARSSIRLVLSSFNQSDAGEYTMRVSAE